MRTELTALVAIFAFTFVTCLNLHAVADDWTQWRGPTRDGAVPANDRELLTYKVQFDNRQDSDRACRAAFEAR